MSLSDDIDYLNQSKQNWNSNEEWLDKLLSVVGQLRNAAEGNTDPNSVGLSLQLSYKETTNLDLVALQASGIVTVAGFKSKWQVPVAIVAKVTVGITDETAQDEIAVTLGGTSIFESQSGALGNVLSQAEYDTSGIIAWPFNSAAVGDLTVSTSSGDDFVTGKIIVGFWYYDVEAAA